MIKRFNPDFSLSISHELAYMRETPEGGYVAHGDYATLFSELELVRAERDRLQQLNEQTLQVKLQMAATIKEQSERADALAVENAALKSNLMFWDADNPELPYDCPEEIANECELNYNDEFEVQVAARLSNRKYRVCESWEYECKLELVEGDEIETPATSAAIAAIEARGVEKLADKLDAEIEQIMRGAFFYDEISSREAISKMVREFAAELREAK